MRQVHQNPGHDPLWLFSALPMRLSPPNEPRIDAPLSQTILEDSFQIAATVKYRNDLQGLRLGPVDDEVGVSRKKLHIFIGKVPAPMSGTGGTSQKCDPVPNDGFHSVRQFDAAVPSA